MPLLNSTEWLEKLVAFDTTSRNSNLELIECIRAFLANECGLSSVIVQKSTDGIHANLWATLPGEGGATDGGIILSGHTDVVPVDGQLWSTDPFKLTEKDGKLYGRGTCDMKGFIAVCLALVPKWQQTPRKKPIHLAFTYNEESDFAGIRQLVAGNEIPLRGAEGCIIGEPTLLQNVIGHKGILSAEVHVHGKAAHSSLTPYGCNAIEYAADVVAFLRGLGKELKDCGPFLKECDPPCTTICATIIAGGNAVNTIPADCCVTFEFRNVPTASQEDIIRRIDAAVSSISSEMQKVDPSCNAQLHVVDRQEAFSANIESRVVLALHAASEAPCRNTYDPGSTEAPDYEQCGIPTVVWGPGDLTMAHKPNEYVEVEQMVQAEQTLTKALDILTESAAVRSQL